MSNSYETLANAIYSGDIEAGKAEAVRLAESGAAPPAIFKECIEPTLKDIGDKFSRLELFLPEMMEAADVVKAVQEALKPYLKAGDSVHSEKGRIVLCTIQGDLHDIGKNIVKAMLEVNGYLVRDLGVNVGPAEILRAAREFNADIIAISALMLPSLPYVKDAIEMIRHTEADRNRFKVMVGGGPLSREWAKNAKADGYGDDAIEAVAQAARLIGK